MTTRKSRHRRLLIFLCALCAAAGNSFAQSSIVRESEIDLLRYETILRDRSAPANVEAKRQALLELRNFQTAAASGVAAVALRDDAEIVRATAAASVVFLPPAEAAGRLIALLADRKPFVRREAARALGVVGDASAVNALLRTVQKDKILEVRNAAVVALGAVGDVAAVPELVKILRRRPTAKEEFTRRAAARSVGQIAQIIQTGRTRVVTPENLLPESYKTIEKPAHTALTETFPGFRPAINRLIEILSDPRESSDVRREAAFALGAVADESAIPILQSKATDEDYYLAEICRESLLKIAAARTARRAAAGV